MHIKDRRLSLSHAGFVGSWYIDYRSNMIRADQDVGRAFGVHSADLLTGLSLDLFDKAYRPCHLELVRKNRRDAIGVGGHSRLRYDLMDFDTGLYRPFESFVHIQVDRFGRLQNARGFLVKQQSSVDVADAAVDPYEAALRSLTTAVKAIEVLKLGHLTPILKCVFKEVARDAISAKIANDP